MTNPNSQQKNSAADSSDPHQSTLPPEDKSLTDTGSFHLNPSQDADSAQGYDATQAGKLAAQIEPPEKLATDNENSRPTQLGRYTIRKLLGRGGFGDVYLAHDPQLDRPVALKVPRRSRFRSAEQVGEFIAEARMAANLKHASLVSVYDVQEESGLPYIVQEYIDGTNLAEWARKSQPDYPTIVRILVEISDALAYLHLRGLTHCDLKLANVLMNSDGKPYVADFGLTVHERWLDQRRGLVFGTPAVMAPEQVRGEGHRLDGRTDIWALGIMLYELLIERQPFTAKTRDELFDEIKHHDPKPPRQIDRRVPKELERICLKCLSKRRTDRYSTAEDLRDDLSAWLSSEASTQASIRSMGSTAAEGGVIPGSDNRSKGRLSTSSPGSDSGPENDSPKESGEGSQRPLKIIPKGLRSFDETDTDFFLDLLPGVRDRDGLPESIRFWKQRIEETNPQRTFTVGLVYGPSGCGKSSLMKAGLLPRLSRSIVAIYLEATVNDTEQCLLTRLREHLPIPDGMQALGEVFTHLRRSGVGRDRKLLIVIDQFEQWLHAHPNLETTDLVSALRQCDGGRVQVLLQVRDDFFASVHRLFQTLDISLVEGVNYALVDRFDKYHSRKVLIAFGRAYGKLQDKLTTADERFLTTAIDELAEDEKVISVRIALFAEMMKSRPWVLESLKQVGGVAGVGVTFLEETFGARTAPPSHRIHEAAIRQVLSALLPEAGTDIKGSMRSRAELAQAAGYGKTKRDFQDLLRILDSELRLITPTDPAGIEDTPATGSNIADAPISRTALAAVSPEQPEVATANSEIKSASAKTGANAQRLTGNEQEQLGQLLYYQLTHDYLVPSLRDWLTRKQRETKKGRAELKLAERAATWAVKPEAKQLPTLWEWISILRLTKKAKWKLGERQLMARANRYHLTRTGLVSAMCVMLLLGVGALKRWNDARQLERDATNLVAALQTTDFSKIPEMIERLDTMRPVADPKLKAALEEFEPQSDERLKLSLGLLASTQQSSDSGQVDYLVQRLLTAQASQVTLLVSQLQPYSQTILPQLWEAAQQHDPKTLLQSASALAKYDPDNEKWQTIAQQVAGHVVQENPLRIAVWIDALRPAAKSLNPKLQSIYASSPESRSQTEIDLATEMLDSYAAEDFQLLHELILMGEPRQFSKLFSNYARFGQQAVDALRGELALPFNSGEPSAGENAPAHHTEARRLVYIQRQANAAVALVRLEDPTPVYQFLTVDRDPGALSQFIFRIRGREVSPSLLIKIFQELEAKAVPTEPQERQQHYYRLYGFVLGLGEYSFDQLPAQQRDAFAVELAELYGTHPSRAVHSALGWLLRRWGQDIAVRRVDETPLDFDESGVREWYVIQINPPVKNRVRNRAAANPTGNSPIDLRAPIYFKMIVFPGGEFDMGNPRATRRVKVDGPIAVSDREVTWRQFSPVDGDAHRQFYEARFKMVLQADVPAFGVNWFEAVNYCRWLTSAMGLDEQYQNYEKKDFPENAEVQPGWIKLPNDTEWPLRAEQPGFRLPTEAEWEYVARAGTETQFSFGESDSLLAEYCWFFRNSKSINPTGQLRPSVGGLFDIHGNLWEWVDDWMTKGWDRVTRGGSWGHVSQGCSSAMRLGGMPGKELSDHVGFRLLRSSVKTTFLESQK